VTNTDIQAAREQLAQAQAELRALGEGEITPAVARAQAQHAEAEANLQAQRDALSHAKTAADAAVVSAANELVRAQAAYGEAASNWNYVQETGNNPAQPTTVNSQGKAVDNEVESAQREQYYAAFVRAGAALQQAQHAVAQAQVQADQARKAEVTGIALAETRVASAQATLTELDAGGVAASRAAARARVASAQAALERLTGERRAGEVAVALANLESAQASLATIQAPARTVDLAVAQAGIVAAEVRLEQAERQLAKATLRAPFAGVIAEVNLDVGEDVKGTGSTVVLGDLSIWIVETNDLTERDVVRITEGAAVEITFEALPDVRLPGTVTSIRPVGADRFGDMTYAVSITPMTWDARLRWNMSATVTITAQP
jgi:HlyD family secretion protein